MGNQFQAIDLIWGCENIVSGFKGKRPFYKVSKGAFIFENKNILPTQRFVKRP